MTTRQRIILALLWATAIAVIALLLCFPPPARGADLATLTKWGLPEGQSRRVGGYVTNFDGRTRCPRWALASLTVDDCKPAAERKDVFRADEAIPIEFRVTPADYRGTGYDRGHVEPAADFNDQEEKDATFLMSNMAPQHPKLNRDLWRRLEQQVRPTFKGERVWVVTAPLWIQDGEHLRIKTIGEHHVWVPTHWGKSTLRTLDGGSGPPELKAWIIPNEEPHADDLPDNHETTVDALESVLGLDLWSGLPDDIEAKLEAGQ